jgi:hypothetical protein
LRTAGAVFLTTVLLALGSSYLFCDSCARSSSSPRWRTASHTIHAVVAARAVRTNDEVGELAVALNQMTSRLGTARNALTRATSSSRTASSPPRGT